MLPYNMTRFVGARLSGVNLTRLALVAVFGVIVRSPRHRTRNDESARLIDLFLLILSFRIFFLSI